MSKAWVAHNYPKNISMVVYADTKGKAKSYLMHTEIFDDYGFMDIDVYRAKSLDYLDRPDGYIMDWNKDEDGIPMVRDAGFCCNEVNRELCEECCAKEWCSAYEEEEEEECDVLRKAKE